MEEFDPGDEGYWKMKDFENYSKSYECNCKLSRIWRNGVTLGKKMVITGFVVSSAPFVLPPLVALSAIGVAFSVPAGFVFATYACGEKLMNTLLPMPSSTPYEKNESMYLDEEEYNVDGDDVDKGYESDDDLENEEQKVEADISKGLEMRIELVEENDKQFDDYDGTLVDKDELDERSSKMNEIVQEGNNEEDVRKYFLEGERPNSKACSEIAEEIPEAETEISFLEKEEGWLPRVSEIVEEGYEEDVGEYMADEEPPLDAKAIPEILEGIREAENEISLMEEEEGGMQRDSLRSAAAASQGGENEMNDEQVMEDTAIVSPRDIKEENEFAGIEEDKPKIERTKLIEEKGDEVEDDQKRKDSPVKETPEEIGKSGIISVKDLPQDKGSKSLTVLEEVESIMDDKGVKTDVGSENNVEQVTRDIKEENEFAGIEEEEPKIERTKLIEEMRDKVEDDQKRKDSPVKETPEDIGKSGIIPVEDLPQDKGSKSLTVLEKVEPIMEDKGVKADLGSENNVEQVTKDMAFIPIREIDEKNGFSGIKQEELRSETTGLIEKMRDEARDDQQRKDSPAKEIPEGNEEFGSVQDMSKDKGNKNITIPEVVEPATDEKDVMIGLEGENNVVQETEDMTFLDIQEENGFAAIEEEEEEEEEWSETRRLNEKMRDVGNDNQKRKDGKETPEEIVESGGVPIKDRSQDKGNTKLTVISKGLEPALNEKGAIFDLKGEANLEDTSIHRDELESAAENQVGVNVKIDGDHAVTEIDQGTGSEKLGNLILSNEDLEVTAGGGFDLSDNGTLKPHQIKMLEGEDQSLNTMVEVAVDYDDIATEPTMPMSRLLGQSLNNMVEETVDYHEVVIELAIPVSAHAEETAKDQGATAVYKVKQEEEKLWEQINAIRTIVGYTNTPHLTFSEELKALYDFTGVELPISSDDPTDLVDINEKLHFLMSIIGVK